MKIVLTNDDGILSEGIYLIYKELKKIGDVTVVAPDREKSSIGHSITLTRPLWKSTVERKGKFFGTALTGTPADCVKYAIRCVLKEKPDLVVSGINPGPNDGCSVFYSGTVAGAREGALNDVPAVALSVNAFQNVDYSAALKYGMKIIKKMLKSPLPKGSFLNINVPHVPIEKIRGIKLTRQGTVPIRTTFSEHENPYGMKYFWMSGVGRSVEKDLSIDRNALANDYVSVTPLQCDQTDHELFLGTSLQF